MTPVLTSFREDERFLNPEALAGSNKAAFLEGAEGLQTMYDPIHPMYSAFDSLWKQELGEVWIGEATAEEAFVYIQLGVDDILRNIEDYE